MIGVVPDQLVWWSRTVEPRIVRYTMNSDLIRFIDSISHEKNIDRESVFCDLEAAMISAARKAYDNAEDVTVQINRESGVIAASVNQEPIDMKTLGRIAAQTAKQVLMQKVREDERNSIFEEYSQKVGVVVTGTVTRCDSGAITINLGRGEGFLPRSEQIPGETHHPGERIRAMILDVREEQSQVRIVLTQTHPDYIRKLFELEVPEVGERVIEIRALAREAGYRTKIAVSSIDIKVDAVGACVGVRGSRIRNIVDELGGEKIDIVRWNESSQILIINALKPAEVKEVFLCFEMGRATVLVDDDQLSLAIGKRGQNVRLAARLTGWDIDILTPAEYDKAIGDMESTLRKVEGVEDVLLDKLLAMGIISLADLAEVGSDPLIKELELESDLAQRLVSVAVEQAKRMAEEAEAAKKAHALEKASQAEDSKNAADASDKAETSDKTDTSGETDTSGGTESDSTTSSDDPADPADPADSTTAEEGTAEDTPSAVITDEAQADQEVPASSEEQNRADSPNEADTVESSETTSN